MMLPGTRVTYRPRLLPKIMSDSVVLPQPGSILMSVAYIAIIGHINAGVWASTCGHKVLLWDSHLGPVAALAPK